MTSQVVRSKSEHENLETYIILVDNELERMGKEAVMA
jgi:hypothetical protein